mmetsp:Transcript_43912/g.107780  ORF Transcript_43912/g.107780 Transcript_43912/m.107780 type:complete len:486 (-) Transcript_43912:135-1592(-)
MPPRDTGTMPAATSSTPRRPRPKSYLYAGMCSLLRRDSSRSSLSTPEDADPPQPPPRRRRILILMSDTGGGHRASAIALKDALEALHPDAVRVAIVDFWVDLAGPPFHNFPQSYAFAAAHPPLWRALYHVSANPLFHSAFNMVADLSAADHVAAAFAHFDPDLIISVHPMVQTITTRTLQRAALHSDVPPPPFVTVVTDLGSAHPMWLHPKTQRLYIPSDPVRALANDVGIDDTRIREYGLPVRQGFWSMAGLGEPALRKRELGLCPEKMTLLLVGGGDGVGKLGQIAVAMAGKLADARLEVQMVIICGRNARLLAELRARRWEVEVHVEGFVSNMSEYMEVADCIVTKAGPGTIAEALICGLPIIVSTYLPGQERANVDFVVENGVGATAETASELADVAVEWLSDPAKLAAMREKAIALAKPAASLDIARDAFQVCLDHEDRRIAAKKARSIRMSGTVEETGFLLGMRLAVLFQSVPAFFKAP